MRILWALLFGGLWGCTGNHAEGFTKSVKTVQPDKMKALREKATAAKVFCRQSQMDTTVAILINMELHSGLKRFIVWDFKKDTIQMAGMVSHGCGVQSWGKDNTKYEPVFSNEKDSHCSSLGKYKIGKRGYSSWGIHVNYLLHGLEKTNSNALARTIVLHSWDAIPDDETYPDGIAESWGCPAVSNNFMHTLDDVLSRRSRPVLLWIYYW